MDPRKTADFGPRTSNVEFAVLGATGLVGTRMLALLLESGIPAARVRALASPRSAGRRVSYGDTEIEVRAVGEDTLRGVDVLIASAGGDASRAWLPRAAALGAVCVDNSSAFRMDPAVPLVVPEVNAHALDGIRIGGGGAIIANPNCSTIQLVVALEPLRRAAGLARVVCSTYQSVSGAGQRAVDAFRDATGAALATGAPAPPGVPAFDVLPLIGGLEASGATDEETKMVRETPKILGVDVPVDVTCVRVPVFVGHAESVLVETSEPLSVEHAAEVLSGAEGVRLWDAGTPPTPARVAGDRGVHVGRLRRSSGSDRGLAFWVVADNLEKGAAWNAVQIAAQVVRAS